MTAPVFAAGFGLRFGVRTRKLFRSRAIDVGRWLINPIQSLVQVRLIFNAGKSYSLSMRYLFRIYSIIYSISNNLFNNLFDNSKMWEFSGNPVATW